MNQHSISMCFFLIISIALVCTSASSAEDLNRNYVIAQLFGGTPDDKQLPRDSDQFEHDPPSMSVPRTPYTTDSGVVAREQAIDECNKITDGINCASRFDAHVNECVSKGETQRSCTSSFASDMKNWENVGNILKGIGEALR